MIPQISSNNLIPGVVPSGTAPLQSASPIRTPVNTGNTGALTFAPPAFDQSNGGVSGAVQATIEMFTLLLSQLAGGGAAQDTPPPAPIPVGNTGNTGGLGNAGGVGGATIPNTTADAQQGARLDGVLSKVAQDPEGSKLLAAAKAKGYTIEVGDPEAAAGGALDKGHGVSCPDCQAALDSGGQVNGVTLSGNEKKIIINPNAPDFEKTVVHELVHAATDGDDNSQQEEGIADVIGYRVANRITGKAQPGNAQSIYLNKMANYQDLGQTNDVRNTLAALGIDAGI